MIDKYSFAILIISDRASQNIYQDKSGPAAEETLRNIFPSNIKDIKTTLIPDDKHIIKEQIQLLHSQNFDFILTSGGTGIGPRDHTPEITQVVVEKEIPGIGEAIRLFSATKTSNAYLSRGTAGLLGKSLVVNLPGSPKAVKEIIPFLKPILMHAHKMIHSVDDH